MAGEWVTFYLGEVCTKIGSGATPRGGSSVYLDRGEIALIRSQNIYNEGFRREGLAFITPEHARELEQVEVMPGDVLLNITGDSVARCCLVDESILPARVNQHVAIVRADPHKLDSRFLRYFLVCPNVQARMVSWAGSGGTRNALTKAMIESFDVHAPRDLGEQRAIAHILGTLDDKIELNRRMNETLEAMARAIFKSWFVDFDPVRAKAEGRLPAPRPNTFYVYAIECDNGSHYIGQTDDLPRRWKDHKAGKVEWTRCHKPARIAHFEEYSTREEAVAREKELKTGFGRKWLKKLIRSGRARQAGQPFGMDAETAARFPDSFQDSPLGKIPKGWRVGKLSELCTTQYGYTASATEEPIGPKFLRVTDINKRNWIEWDSVPHCRIGEEDKSRYSLAVGDIVVARMADPGKSAIIEEQVDAIFASYLVRLKTSSWATAYFVYGFLKSQTYDEYSQGVMSGSVQANMNAKLIVGADLPIPPDKLIYAYAERAVPLRQRIVANLRQSSTLATIRDALLPKLISGEIRVKEQHQSTFTT
jgi:restriction endonuclease S subunit